MDFLKSLLSDFDPSALVPDLAELFNNMTPLLRLLVMAGPVCMLVLGLMYLLKPPAEANHIFGYRFFWGMSSVEAWRFTQKVSGMTWSILGLVMTVVMLFLTGGYGDLEWEAMLFSALWALVCQLVIVVISVALINLVVLLFFDHKGSRRSWSKK